MDAHTSVNRQNIMKIWSKGALILIFGCIRRINVSNAGVRESETAKISDNVIPRIFILPAALVRSISAR